VRRWEDRLVGLLAGVATVRPSPRVWREIELRTSTRVRTGETVGARPSVRPMRFLALAATLAALVFGVSLYLADARRTWELAAEIAAPQATAPAWSIEIDRRADELRVRAMNAPALAADREHELWALVDGAAAPVSLGLLPQAGEARLTLGPAQRTALARASKVAVSLEPRGGSPTGAPTGPVLFVADVRPPRHSST
jgi:anti-sigma-K factor RskA